MKTVERRAHADEALKKLRQLELEIKSQIVGVANPGLPLDEDYISFHAYSHLRLLNEEYKDWKRRYEAHADNSDLVALIGQTAHDILREDQAGISSLTVVMPMNTKDSMSFYEHQVDTRTSYAIHLKALAGLSFLSQFQPALDIVFVRVDAYGHPR